MLDPRIPIYRQAAHAMKSGRFRLDLPLGGDDEVARLGRALQELGLTLERKFGEVRQLLKVTEEINAGLLLDEVLDHVYDSFRPIIPYDRIGFSLLEETDAGTVARARWARSDTHDIRLPQGYQVALQESSLRHIIESGQPRILNDLIAYLDAHPDSDATRKIVAEGMRSSLTCPLVTSGKPVGFMFFSSKQPSTYRDVHVEIYLQIAGQLAAIVEKGRLYQRLLELDRLKNKFLGIAAHDLRSPIATVKGYISILLGDMFGRSTISSAS